MEPRFEQLRADVLVLFNIMVDGLVGGQLHCTGFGFMEQMSFLFIGRHVFADVQHDVEWCVCNFFGGKEGGHFARQAGEDETFKMFLFFKVLLRCCRICRYLCVPDEMLPSRTHVTSLAARLSG